MIISIECRSPTPQWILSFSSSTLSLKRHFSSVVWIVLQWTKIVKLFDLTLNKSRLYKDNAGKKKVIKRSLAFKQTNQSLIKYNLRCIDSKALYWWEYQFTSCKWKLEMIRWEWCFTCESFSHAKTIDSLAKVAHVYTKCWINTKKAGWCVVCYLARACYTDKFYWLAWFSMACFPLELVLLL